MEEALRESEAKYRQIFENVQDIFYRTDLEGTILELSPSVERYGYSREALIGTPAGRAVRESGATFRASPDAT